MSPMSGTREDEWTVWLREAHETMDALRAHASDSLRRARLLWARYHRLASFCSDPPRKLLPDLPWACFFPGHEEPLATLLADLIVSAAKECEDAKDKEGVPREFPPGKHAYKPHFR
jgi:hypothetical protein